MTTFRILLFALCAVALPAYADIGATACARSQDIVENAKGSAIDSTKRTAILDNLYARACVKYGSDAVAGPICALGSPTQAQKCTAFNRSVYLGLRGETGIPARSASEAAANAAQNAAEADWD